VVVSEVVGNLMRIRKFHITGIESEDGKQCAKCILKISNTFAALERLYNMEVTRGLRSY
jgi:hypothetical protein